MQPSFKRYYLELGAALLAYAALLVLSIDVAEHMRQDAPLRTLVVLTPMVPCGAAAWAIMRQLRRMDELQMRIQLEALGFSFAGTALLTFGYGFLEGGGFPRLSLFTVWPVMATLWIMGCLLARRRYQ